MNWLSPVKQSGRYNEIAWSQLHNTQGFPVKYWRIATNTSKHKHTEAYSSVNCCLPNSQAVYDLLMGVSGHYNLVTVM